MDDDPPPLQRALLAQVCRVLPERVHADDERSVHGAGVHDQACCCSAVTVGVEPCVVGEDTTHVGLWVSGVGHRLGLRVRLVLLMVGGFPWMALMASRPMARASRPPPVSASDSARALAMLTCREPSMSSACSRAAMTRMLHGSR